MKIKLAIFFGILSLLLICASSNLALAEDQSNNQQASQLRGDVDTQWRWGEVVNLDAQNKTLTIKYLDFDTDQEKDLPLIVDESTAYENIKSLEDIQLKDTLSVDFVVSDSKNIAKNISKEKAEDSTIPPKLEEDKTAPVETQVAPGAPVQPELTTSTDNAESPAQSSSSN